MKFLDIFNNKTRPYFIAELSGNHNGSLQNALKLIECAADAGADAVKLQTYTAETMTIESNFPDFYIQHGAWKGYTLHQLYHEACTPWEWHDELFSHARKYGLECLSTPFDTTAVDFLGKFDPPAYKVASFEVNDIPLLRKISEKKRPVILSTGMARLSDLEAALKVFNENEIKVVLLHCVSEYPASDHDMNLITLDYLRKVFKVRTGLSDHSPNSIASIVATSLGAAVIEKHICLDRSLGGTDAFFSLEPSEFSLMVEQCKSAYNALGDKNSILNRKLSYNKQFMRSIYAVEDINVGEEFTNHNIRSIRPGFGLPPKYMDCLVGSVSRRDIKKGTPIKLSDL